MSTKTRGKDGQHDRFEYFKGGIHTHDFYDSETGKMGSHGENCDRESKKWLGERSTNDTCRGSR